jgi:TonB family protein
MTAIAQNSVAFKRAVVLSLTVHMIVLILAVLSPRLPKSRSKEMIHYVSVVSFPGGGGSGGVGGVQTVDTPLPKRETLRDLTTPQKIQKESNSSFRHPVEKPKKEEKPETEKKAAIQKKQSALQKAPEGHPAQKDAAEGSRTGSGVRIGGGGPGTGGTGSGSGAAAGSAFSSQIGLSNFPYTYYLQIIIDKVSGNWFTSLVDPGISGNFQTTVHFKIQKNGQVSDLKIEESSGIRSLDMSALRAVQTSAPFPSLPRAYEDEYLGIYLIFEHSK